MESITSTTLCGRGRGMAACPALGLVATSCMENNTVSVFSLPGFDLLYTMGGPGQPLAETFKFSDFDGGLLAFIAPETGGTHLFVSRYKSREVTIIDLTSRTAVGILTAKVPDEQPSLSLSVSGIASRGNIAAVSVVGNRREDRFAAYVQLFKGGPIEWEFARYLHFGPDDFYRHITQPRRLKLSMDGKSVVVAEEENHRAIRFSVETGEFEGSVCFRAAYASDVEEIPGGWCVAYGIPESKMVFAARDGTCAAEEGCVMDLCSNYLCIPALAWVPGVGLLTRCSCQAAKLHVRALPDSVLMQGMSEARVSWMGAAARAMCVNKDVLDVFEVD